MVGELRLAGRQDAQPLAPDRVTGATAPGPGGQHVVHPPVGIQRHRGQGIGIRPGVPGSTVAGDLPGVVEDQARRGRRGPPGEHAELVGVRSGVEIAADHGGMAAAGPLGDELRELAYLRLPCRARVQPVVQHHDEQLERPAIAVDHGEQRGTAAVLVAVAGQSTTLVRGHRPARRQAEPGDPALLRPAAREDAVPEAEPPGNLGRLVRLPGGPALHQADHVRGGRRQRLLDPGLPLGPAAELSPDVPGHDPHRGFRDWPVGRVLVEAHPCSLALSSLPRGRRPGCDARRGPRHASRTGRCPWRCSAWRW